MQIEPGEEVGRRPVQLPVLRVEVPSEGGGDVFWSLRRLGADRVEEGEDSGVIWGWSLVMWLWQIGRGGGDDCVDEGVP